MIDSLNVDSINVSKIVEIKRTDLLVYNKHGSKLVCQNGKELDRLINADKKMVPLCDDILCIQNQILSNIKYRVKNAPNKAEARRQSQMKFDFATYSQNIESIVNCVNESASQNIAIWKQKNSNTIRLEEIQHVNQQSFAQWFVIF